jgi:hypothetical protein
VKVTRIAISQDLNPGKYDALLEQARRLGRVRTEVWQRYGSIGGVRLRDRQIRDAWMADGTAAGFGVLDVAGIVFTARCAGWCGRQTMRQRSRLSAGSPIPTSACTPRILG